MFLYFTGLHLSIFGSDDVTQAFINQETLYVMVKLVQPKYSMMSFAKHVKATALSAKSGLVLFLPSCNFTNETSLLPPQFIQSHGFYHVSSSL